MQISERIKKVREYRNIKQKDLGVAIGFPATSASVRIAQYENGSRMPKKETAIAISKVLQCNYINFYDGADLSEAERIMMDFFWLEESMSGSLYIFQLQNITIRRMTVSLMVCSMATSMTVFFHLLPWLLITIKLMILCANGQYIFKSGKGKK